MTVPAPQQPGLPTSEEPPRTGNAAVDAALAAVRDSHGLAPAEQAESLAAAHERLHAALDAERDATGAA